VAPERNARKGVAGKPQGRRKKMKFRFSSYVIPYLRFCEDRPRTIGTFFAYRLRGRARDYAGRYARALQRSLEFLEGNLAVERVPSVCGGEAWKKTWDWETIEDAFVVYAASAESEGGVR
jgi:hypothetical protein